MVIFKFAVRLRNLFVHLQGDFLIACRKIAIVQPKHGVHTCPFKSFQVHVFLYLYYGLTAMGWQPSWKRRLTELQIVQFVIDLVHASIGVLKHNFCYWSLGYGLSMLYLFSAFYVRTYLRVEKKKL